MGDELLRHDAAGAFPEQIHQAEAFVTANMRRGIRIRDSTPGGDRVSGGRVHEAIVNAVAHRDYADRGDDLRVMCSAIIWRFTAEAGCPAT